MTNLELTKTKGGRPTTAELITLLEAKAKDKDTTAKDLVMLTKEIDRLTDKMSKTGNLF